MAENVYKSDLTPKPGPLGGSVSEVKPPAGSQEKRPPLAKTKPKEKFKVLTYKQRIILMSGSIFSVPGPRWRDSACFQFIDDLF